MGSIRIPNPNPNPNTIPNPNPNPNPKVMPTSHYSPWASNRFLEYTIFGNLSHRAIEIRLPAKISVLDKAVRALFSKWPPNFNKCLVFGTIFFFFVFRQFSFSLMKYNHFGLYFITIKSS